MTIKPIVTAAVIFFICVSLPAYSYSQQAKRLLKGVVVDAITGLQLTHVSITVRQPSTSLALNTISADNGSFQIRDISGDDFSLELTAIGYKDTLLTVSAKNRSYIDIGEIRIVSLVKPMRPVNVYAQKPLIEQTADNLIYNVDADPENAYLNAFEVLRKVPLITTDANDNIQLNGNNNFKIFVNGKPSLIFSANPQSVLQSLQGSSIQSISVMTIPPARYQSEGVGGIINISTFTSIRGGVNGGANIRALELDGMQTSGDFTAGNKKLSISVNANYLDRHLPSSNALTTRVDKLLGQTLTQNNVDKRTASSLNNGIELIYQPGERNVITLSAMRNSGSNDSRRRQGSELYDEISKTISVFSSLNSTHNHIATTDYFADFTHTFKNDDAHLFNISYKLSRSDASNKMWFLREPAMSELSNGKNVYTDDQGDYYFEANYAHPLKQHLFELGIANTRRISGSSSMYMHFDNGIRDYILNEQGSGDFYVKENINAAYMSVRFKFGRWSLTTSGRWENAAMRFNVMSGAFQKNDYSYVIPNVSLSRQLKGNSLVRAGYSQRITRPDISYLDPYINNWDLFNISYGNPHLKPTLSHVVNFTYTKVIRRFFVTLNASHQFTDNSIEQITRIGTDTVSRTTYENIGLYSNTIGSVSLNTFLFKKINVNTNLSANYVRFGEYADLKRGISSGTTYNAGITATANLQKWSIAGYVSYLSGTLSVQGKTTTFITNSLTVSRRMLTKNNLIFSLTASEPFVRRRMTTSEYSAAQFLVRQRQTTLNTQLNASLNYRFAVTRVE